MFTQQFITESFRLLLPPGAVTELRILNTPRGTASGHLSDFNKLAAEAGRWSGKVTVHDPDNAT